jgi:hypothetical protein
MDVKGYNDFFKKFLDKDKYLPPVGDSVSIVKSFYEIDLLDMQKATADLKANKYKDDKLILEDFTVGTVAKNMDQVNDKFMGAFLVIGQFNIKGGSNEDKTTLKNKTFNEAKLIINTMIAGKRSGCNVMAGLDVNSIVMEKVGPVLDQHYGWRVSFDLLIAN